MAPGIIASARDRLVSISNISSVRAHIEIGRDVPMDNPTDLNKSGFATQKVTNGSINVHFPFTFGYLTVVFKNRFDGFKIEIRQDLAHKDIPVVKGLFGASHSEVNVTEFPRVIARGVQGRRRGLGRF